MTTANASSRLNLTVTDFISLPPPHGRGAILPEQSGHGMYSIGLKLCRLSLRLPSKIAPLPLHLRQEGLGSFMAIQGDFNFSFSGIRVTSPVSLFIFPPYLICLI